MEIGVWVLIGSIIGVISTTWQPVLSIRKLILSVVTGVIGSVASGVIGYILYDSSMNGLNVSIFAIALIVTSLYIIGRRKIDQIIIKYKLLHPKVFLLPSGTSDIATGDIAGVQV